MGKPHLVLLNRRRITEAALQLVDQESTLSVEQLAAELNTTPAALSSHVQGEADIIALLREFIVQEIEKVIDWDQQWDRALADWARAYRDTFSRHPGLVRELALAPMPEPFLHAFYEKAVTVLESGGFPRPLVMGMITALESFILGSALDLAAPAVMVDRVNRAAQPRLAAAVDVLPTGPLRAEQAFETGLAAQLDGYRQLLR